MDLAIASVDELAVDINSSKESAATFIMPAQKLLRESKMIENVIPDNMTNSYSPASPYPFRVG